MLVLQYCVRKKISKYFLTHSVDLNISILLRNNIVCDIVFIETLLRKYMYTQTYLLPDSMCLKKDIAALKIE